MEKKPTMENTETKTLNISLRKELIKRVEVFCAEKKITVRDFVTDAIIEKIELAYKERRKKKQTVKRNTKKPFRIITKQRRSWTFYETVIL